MRKPLILRLSGLLVALLLVSWQVLPAAAQTAPPDFAQFGFPRATGSVSFTPGTAATLTAGQQKVVIPADFLSKPVTFELLEGEAAYFNPDLGDGKGMQVVATFAFRVTDPATNQRVAAFEKPVQWSITAPFIVPESAVFNTSATNPVKVVKNPVSPGTVTGQTLAHPFGGAGVGWLVLNPAAASAPPAPAVPGAAPSTGGGATSTTSPDLTTFGLIAALVLIVASVGGLQVRRRSNKIH